MIASLVPMTNPELTPPGNAIYAHQSRDAVIFSPHPRTKKTSNEVVQIMREVAGARRAPRPTSCNACRSHHPACRRN